MANSKAGERIDGAGRQREYIGEEIWEEGSRSEKKKGSATYLHSQTCSKKGKKRYTKTEKGKNPEAKDNLRKAG